MATVFNPAFNTSVFRKAFTSAFASVYGDAVLSGYAVDGINPDFVYDPSSGTYYVAGSSSSLSSTSSFSRSSNSTMIDSDGLLKWAPHNLALNSASPATQSITVISGADYTVECTGSGSITLSGAGTGTVSDGSPVEVTASTTSLTLTVSGSLDRMWAYRSDLGGMVNNPATGNSYVPTTSTAEYLSRVGHHVYNGSEWVNEGEWIEPEARTNLLHTTDDLVTQSTTVTNEPHTLQFTGTGTVTLSGASTAGPLVGTGTGEENRVYLTFTPSAASLTLTVSGTVTDAQLEVGSTPSSYIPNLAGSGTVTRAADTLSIPAANLPYDSTAMTIAMSGKMTYADTDAFNEAQFINWRVDGNDQIALYLRNSGTRTGEVQFQQVAGGTSDLVAGTGSQYSPGVNVPFKIASRHTSSEINGAVDGAALTADTTPTALPDLSATDMDLASVGGGIIIKTLRIWGNGVGLTDTQLESATS